jgi:hypothetical protein
MEKNLKMDYQRLNGLLVNLQINRRKYAISYRTWKEKKEKG